MLGILYLLKFRNDDDDDGGGMNAITSVVINAGASSVCLFACLFSSFVITFGLESQ
jgi:hypothetical protein